MKSPRWASADGVALLVAAVAAAATQVRSYDLGWHLKVGEWILRKGAIPRADMLSFTGDGVPWIDHGWLWQAAAWPLYALGGFHALALLKILSAAVVALVGHRILRRAGWGPHGAAWLILLVLAGARFRFGDRPETAALALLALFLHVAVSEGVRLRWRVLLTVPLCALWANIHASVLVAPVLGAALAAGSLIGCLRARSRGQPESRSLLRAARGEAAVAFSAVAGLLVNPYGLHLLSVPFHLSETLADPRLVNPEWLRPALDAFPLFHATLAASLALVAIRIVRFADPSAWRALLLAGVPGGLALSSARHVGIFFAALPFVAALLGGPGGWRRIAGGRQGEAEARRRRALPPAWAAGWGLSAAILFAILPDGHGALPGFGLQPGRFPEREADYVAENLDPPRRMFNDVAHGGYLALRFFPEDRLFIDGRNEVHAVLLREIAGALDDGRAWRALLERHRIGTAILRFREERIPVAGEPAGEARSFAALHFPRSAWALVFWGDAAMVFVKRDAGHEQLIARDEYEHLHPEDWEYLLQRCRSGDAVLRDRILEEIRRRLDTGPRCDRAEDLYRRFQAVP